MSSGEIESETPANPQRYYTVHNVRDLLGLIDSQSRAKKAALKERMDRMQKRMYNSIDKLESISSDEKAILLYANPCFNGQLKERYLEYLKLNGYPQIRSFPTVLRAIIGCMEVDGSLTEDIYEDNHGNGYFTFRII